MIAIGSWRYWVIAALALTTLACAGRRERREEAREERRERAEQRRAERLERTEQRRASGEPAPMSARERREAQRRERAEQRQAARAQPQPQSEPQPQAEPQPQPQAAVQRTSVSVAPPEAPSRVIFMRVSKQSSSTNALLFDVSEAGDPKLIGNVGPASKLSYSLQPGLYTFMVLGDTAEFMQATIVGGKTYYALVIPRGGATRFSVEPIRHSEIGGKEFAGWDRGTKPMGGSAASASYDAAAAAEKRVRYWQEWSKKSETQRAELTLNAEDGR